MSRTKNGVIRPEYWVWRDIKQRCLNPNNNSYKNYGARGITVTPSWREFEVFFEDMGERPSPKHTIHRIDNDSGYRPGNCQWALRREQGDNRRGSQRITFRGETHSAAEWSRKLGLSYRTVQQRIGKLGWTAARALTTPTL